MPSKRPLGAGTSCSKVFAILIYPIDIRDSALRNVARDKRQTEEFVQMPCILMVMSCNIRTCHRCHFVILVTNEAAMAGDSGKKLFVGPRFRRIRQQLGLSQTQMAEGLGISPSYI